jgi:DNA mismatch repair protein MutS
MSSRSYDAGLDEPAHRHPHRSVPLELSATDAGVPSLKLAYNRVSGFYGNVAFMPARAQGHIRRQTVKSAERFITPELKSFEDKVLGARDKALARERELYEEGIDAAHRPARGAAGHRGRVVLARLPVALAERAAQLGWTNLPCGRDRPEIRGSAIPWSNISSPVRSCPTTWPLDASRRMLIVTGPYRGKSTYMRQAHDRPARACQQLRARRTLRAGRWIAFSRASARA